MSNTRKIKPNIIAFITIPFHNEVAILPGLFRSFYSSCKRPADFAIVGVDHSSTDNSGRVFQELAKFFGFYETLHESYPLASVGIPRKKGLDQIHQYAITQKQIYGTEAIIGSLDADALVNTHFFTELTRHQKKSTKILY